VEDFSHLEYLATSKAVLQMSCENVGTENVKMSIFRLSPVVKMEWVR
jgi:hypothetical protein